MLVQILTCCLLFNGMVDTQNCDNDKYAFAIAYLQSEVKSIEIISKTFPKKIRRRDKAVFFEMDSMVKPIPIYYFGNVVNLREVITISSEDFDNNYYFDAYKSEFLCHYSKPNKSKFILSFSKPINNILICEIFDKDLYNGSIKLGYAVQALFLFDKNNTIENVIFKSTMYN